MSAARAEVLRRVRAATDDVPADERPADVPVPRAYRRGAGPGDLALLVQRLVDYGASVSSCAPDAVAAAVGQACTEHGARRIAVAAGLPDAWRPDGVELVRDDPPIAARELDALDGALTGCVAAAAETGTIALDGSGSCGRRAVTLVPDLHVCVVRAEQVVATVADLLAALDHAARARRPITLVSGPSATSDIELHRVEGVHGPRRLEIVLVGRAG